MDTARDLTLRLGEPKYDAIRETAPPELTAHFLESYDQRTGTIQRALASAPTGVRLREVGPAGFGLALVRDFDVYGEACDRDPWSPPVYIVCQARWKAPTETS